MSQVKNGASDGCDLIFERVEKFPVVVKTEFLCEIRKCKNCPSRIFINLNDFRQKYRFYCKLCTFIRRKSRLNDLFNDL